MEFGRMQPDDVVWEPYSVRAIMARAPLGLSFLCTRDKVYWMTLVPMVFDIVIEPHCSQRVMRQFGLRQHFPMVVERTVPPGVRLLVQQQTSYNLLCR